MAHIKQPNKYLLVSQSLRVQRGQRDFIERGLLPASRYMTALEEEFRKVGVPLELTKLAFVESSFNVLAYSKVGASGIYQIMPATAKQYGMKESDFYDERRDPVKSARAAAKLLKLNYKITGSWPLSITAYNHGVGSIKKAIRKTRSSDITHIVHNYEAKSFGFASQNFYTGFLGLLATLEEKEKLFPNVKFDQPIKFQNVKLKRPISISIILRRSHVTPDEFAELNPDIFRRYIKRGGILPQGYVVKLPQRVQVSSSF